MHMYMCVHAKDYVFMSCMVQVTVSFVRIARLLTSMNCSYTAVTFDEQSSGVALVSWYRFGLGGDVDPFKKLKAQVYDGIIVMDQFGMIEGNMKFKSMDVNVPWQSMLGTLLYEVYLRTGLKCVAICMEHAVFDETDHNIWSYGYMMHWMSYYFYPPRFMLWVSQGNDVYPLLDPPESFYPEDRIRSKASVISQQVSTLLTAARSFCAEQRMVFGFDSETLELYRYKDGSMCAAYDTCCEAVTHQVRTLARRPSRTVYHSWSLFAKRPGVDSILSDWEHTFPCISGARLFNGIHFEDGGRVSYQSFSILCKAFTVLTKWGMTPANSSILYRLTNHWNHGTPFWKLRISKL